MLESMSFNLQWGGDTSGSRSRSRRLGLSIRPVAGAVLLALCGLPVLAEACDHGSLSPALLTTALQLSGSDQEAVVYAAVQQTAPRHLVEGLAGALLRQQLIPTALQTAAGDAARLSQELDRKLDQLCELLPNDGASVMLASPAPPPPPSPKPAMERPLPPAGDAQIVESLDRARIESKVAGNLFKANPPSSNDKDTAPAPPLAPAAAADGAAKPKPAPSSASDALISQLQHDCDAQRLRGKTEDKKATGRIIFDTEQCVKSAERLYEQLPADAKEKARPSLQALHARLAQLKAHNGLLIGARNTLKSDGSYDSGAELLAFFNADVIGGGEGWYCPGFLSWCRGYTEIGYLKRKLDDGEEAESINPFANAGGVIRLNFGYKTHWSDWLGINFGMGLTSPQDVQGESRLRTRPRFYTGLDFESVYERLNGERLGFGQVFAGLAYDRFWEQCLPGSGDPAPPCASTQQNYGRFVVDARYLIPHAELGGFKLAARGYFDKPLNGRGDSDVGIGIYVFQDIGDWLNGIGK